MSQKGWVVLLALAGAVFCVGYLYLANKYCPVESTAPNLNWRLVPDLNKNEKHDRAAYRYGRRKEERHAGSVIFPPSYSLIQKVETGKDAESRNGEGHIWLTKFVCDAKLSDLLLAIFTYGLFLATGWLVWATLKLWQAALDTAEKQERDTQILQRAYLAVSPRGIYSLSGTSIDVCVAHICIRNVGRLPARNVTWFITSTISESPVFNDMEVDRNLAAGEVTIAPGIDAVQGGDLIFASDLETAKALKPTGFCYVRIAPILATAKRRAAKACELRDSIATRSPFLSPRPSRPRPSRLQIASISEKVQT
jgi:hypothetical protein